ncbi:enoyl-CoA hydratase/isomerase family protein [Chromohalobacter israelensis]|uniref:enoyl-CoA hydratase/isomerase family protein n=1 Tax=Chromohalobacter israelensis TaxID=141390 RepID=UPI000551C77D|nr:enoyl-CoA hydratase/isomerase family protein [Chromohalobacter israelensis]MDF9433622.1 enoyl-CoA hydratase/isomerase family protein [Chromohalobacter israelensis]
MTEPMVTFEEKPTRDGGCIGVATLNAPDSLNALSLTMLHALHARLEAWAQAPTVHAVWLQGAGGKAFCAGGDVVALYHAMRGAHEGGADVATAYFSAEYRLDHFLHHYPKPLIAWGDGVVMGGGLGLLQGAGHRVVTDTSRLAMPEISIGLYPDVGASWFLSRMPGGVGLYVGVTGAHLNARDALDLGLADRFIPHAAREDVLDALTRADHRSPHHAVRQVLEAFEARARAPEAQVMPRLDHLQALSDGADIATVVQRILDDTREDAWLAANRERLAAGCPATAHLVWRMLCRHRHGGLAETFRDELALSVQCCRHTELAEGIRALLIDKDKAPRWAYPDVASVPPSYIDGFFMPLWDADTHPLADL